MASPWPMLWLGLPGNYEWMLILVVGLLLFGRRLPEVGRSLGKTITEFRRGLNKFKSEMDSDPEFREARSAVHDIHRTLRAPAEFASPKRVFERLTDESLATTAPVPPSGADEGAGPSQTEPARHEPKTEPEGSNGRE